MTNEVKKECPFWGCEEWSGQVMRPDDKTTVIRIVCDECEAEGPPVVCVTTEPANGDFAAAKQRWTARFKTTRGVSL